MPNQLIVNEKLNNFKKKIIVSGDKSISIRWVLFSSLAEGVSKAKNLLISESLKNSESEKESFKNELTLLKNSQISQETRQSNKNALDEANKTIQGLQNGNKVLQKTIESLEKEKLALKAQAVDGGKFIVGIPNILVTSNQTSLYILSYNFGNHLT